MTKAKAATVVAALVNADYHAHAHQTGDGTWTVIARDPNGLTPINTIKTFQDAQAVTAATNEAVFT
jgi:hypothetical protein